MPEFVSTKRYESRAALENTQNKTVRALTVRRKAPIVRAVTVCAANLSGVRPLADRLASHRGDSVRVGRLLILAIVFTARRKR